MPRLIDGSYPTLAYFARASNGLIKIGQTISPGRRLTLLRRTARERGFGNIEYIGIVRAVPWQTEEDLHIRFMEHCYSTEWFHPHPDLVQYIESLRPDFLTPEECQQFDYARMHCDCGQWTAWSAKHNGHQCASDAVRTNRVALIGIWRRINPPEVLTAEQRRERARKAADARWKKN